MATPKPPNRRPSVTVAMSVYNGAEFLAAAIESILNQTFDDFEFLIVNDGSTDATPEIIEYFSGHDKRIRAIHQRNNGLVSSLNILIDEARAPLIARMDSDDISLPDRFMRQLHFMQENPQCSLVGTQVIEIDEQSNPTKMNIIKPVEHHDIFSQLGIAVPICHPSIMMRTDTIRRLKGYRPLYRHCEDLDLWFRMGEISEIRNLADTLLLYRRSANQISVRNALDQHYGAIFARLASQERLTGGPDPSDRLAVLPPLEELDTLFRRSGITESVRGQLALGLVYSRDALKGRGFKILADHVRSGGRRDGLWRAVVRMLTMGLPARSAQLAGILLTAQMRH